MTTVRTRVVGYEPTDKVSSTLSELNVWCRGRKNRGRVPSKRLIEEIYYDGYMSGVGISKLCDRIKCSKERVAIWLRHYGLPLYGHPEWQMIVFGPAVKSGNADSDTVWAKRRTVADRRVRIRRHNVEIIGRATGRGARDIALDLMDGTKNYLTDFVTSPAHLALMNREAGDEE